jgi:hypothetical protein
MRAEIKRLQRRFNAALEDNDAEMAVEAGIELVKAINSKPKLTEKDRFYREVVENMVVLMKSLDTMHKNGDIDGMSQEERRELPFILIDMIFKMMRKRRAN